MNLFRASHNWEIWGNALPEDALCLKGSGGKCACRYHVISKDRKSVCGTMEWSEAEEEFITRTGLRKFNAERHQIIE